MLLQHYHTSTNLSKKIDASLRYLQLQLGPMNTAPGVLMVELMRSLAVRRSAVGVLLLPGKSMRLPSTVPTNQENDSVLFHVWTVGCISSHRMVLLLLLLCSPTSYFHSKNTRNSKNSTSTPLSLAHPCAIFSYLK